MKKLLSGRRAHRRHVTFNLQAQFRRRSELAFVTQFLPNFYLQLRPVKVAGKIQKMRLDAQLWLGRGSLPSVAQLRSDLADQLQKNEQAIQANSQLEAEVHDLKEGLEMVEEKARMELGMVKTNEIYVQISR